jgi:2-(1,2-epoxy-1,2-dihydrophenyl)acetyl-CoA isomerase
MFCPGADLEWLRPLEEGAEQRIDELLPRLNPLLAHLRELPMIVVAAVHGAVAGGGLGLMNAADIVIASSETKFNLAYSRIGATPDLGATFYLPRLIGERRAMELMLLSDSFDAARARELGLVNFVASQETFDAEVDHLVKRLLDGPSEAHASIKRMIYAPTVSDLALQHEAERRNLLAAVRGAELGEGVRAFVSKRAPRFNAPAEDAS